MLLQLLPHELVLLTTLLMSSSPPHPLDTSSSSTIEQDELDNECCTLGDSSSSSPSSSACKNDFTKYFSTRRREGRCSGSGRNSEEIKRFSEGAQDSDSTRTSRLLEGTEPHSSEYTTTPSEYKSTSSPWPGCDNSGALNTSRNCSGTAAGASTKVLKLGVILVGEDDLGGGTRTTRLSPVTVRSLARLKWLKRDTISCSAQMCR
mmetsp:Transcript_8249/g.13995  ORF Transcript_8249/g.13995 Transcript_8249/m.13995 type:complete len:205 (+) Transcript_8249:217-831(+)